MDTNDHNGASQPSGALSAALELVRNALADLRFGAINLVVHDGQVVQIDVTEKKRLAN